jgi:hypothetical protein
MDFCILSPRCENSPEPKTKKQKHCSGEEPTRSAINFLKHHWDYKSGLSSVRTEAHKVAFAGFLYFYASPRPRKASHYYCKLLHKSMPFCRLLGWKCDDALQSDDNFNCKISKPFFATYVQATMSNLTIGSSWCCHKNPFVVFFSTVFPPPSSIPPRWLDFSAARF